MRFSGPAFTLREHLIYPVHIFLSLWSTQFLGAGASDTLEWCSPLDSSSPTALNAVCSPPPLLEWSPHTCPLVWCTVSYPHPPSTSIMPPSLQSTSSVLSSVALPFLSGDCKRHGPVSPESHETFPRVARISAQTFHLKCKTDSFPPSCLSSLPPTGSAIVQAGLELPILPHPPCAGIAGIHSHIWLCVCPWNSRS